MTIDELITAAQDLVDGLLALKNAQQSEPHPIEVDVKESDDTEETFVPKDTSGAALGNAPSTE